MNPSRVAAVVFDVDDTLYLERDYILSGFRAVGDALYERFGIYGAGDALWRHFLAGTRGNTFDLVLAELGLPSSAHLVADLVNLYRDHKAAINLLPDARSCLETLRGSVDIAIITDGPMTSQRTKIRSLHLDDFASLVIVTSEHGPNFAKPSPEAFHLVEATFGLGGEACVYVADNPAKDFHAPLARDWTAVRVRRPGGLYQGAAVTSSVLEVDNLWRLPAVLGIPGVKPHSFQSQMPRG